MLISVCGLALKILEFLFFFFKRFSFFKYSHSLFKDHAFFRGHKSLTHRKEGALLSVILPSDFLI